MKCEHCKTNMVKFGSDRKGQQCYRCLSCGRFKPSTARRFDEMMKE